PTATPTGTPTITPTSTPTSTASNTPTRTSAVVVPTFTSTATPTATGTPPAVVGCRVTGGRVTSNGIVEPDAQISKGSGGGQVGAPCGCIGCFDEFNMIQGNWQYSRKKQQGIFHATDFNSLVCGCDGGPTCSSPVGLTGNLCNPGDSTCGPGSPLAPANL